MVFGDVIEPQRRHTEVKHDFRIIVIKACSEKPGVTPASKFLMLDAFFVWQIGAATDGS